MGTIIFRIYICFMQMLYVPVLANKTIAYLKAYYIKEIDTTKAQEDFNRMFDSLVTIGVPEDKAEMEALACMLSKFDPYLHVLSPDVMRAFQGEQACVGLSFIKDGIEIRIVGVIEGSQASEVGIKRGDYILAIDDRSTMAMDATDVMGYLRGEQGSKVKLEILKFDEQDTVTFMLERRKSYLPSVSRFCIINGDIGHIHLMEFGRTTFDEMNRIADSLKAANIKKLIIDLRYNKGGLLEQTEEVISLFLPKGREIVSLRNFRNKKVEKHKSKKEYLFFQNLPLVILVNKYSAAASEIFAGALQDWDRALILGEKTHGEGVIKYTLYLDFGYGINLPTHLGILPSGRTYDAFFENPEKKTRGYQTKLRGRPVDNGPIVPDIALSQENRYYVTDSIYDDPWIIQAIKVLKQTENTQDLFELQ